MDFKTEKAYKEYEQHCQKVRKATLLHLEESPEAKFKRIAGLEKDYIAWFEYYFPHYTRSRTKEKISCAPFHRTLANSIINNRKSKTLAEIYRSGAKSSHITMGIPLFLMVIGEMRFMLLIGKTELKAKKLIGAIQAELQYNQRLINDYGRLYKLGDWSVGDFATSTGVRFMSLGFGQDPRGVKEGAERPDYIVPDDIDGKTHINNDRIMRESVDYLMEDIMGCFDATDDAPERFAYANNNFHKNSITNRLKIEFQNAINADKDEGSKSDYKIITVTAVKDLVNFEPTWPEKTSAEYWKAKYRKRRRSFLREYMHTHVEDGAIFQHEDILYSDPLALKDYDALCFYGDLSYKAQGDYKALVLVGKKDKEFHILLTYLRQKSRSDCAAWLYDTYEHYNLSKYNIRYMIEGLFAMDEFINDFDDEGRRRGYFIPVVADKRPKEGKYDRIESLLGFFERHNVFFNAKMNNADQQTLVEQFLAFEKGSQAHDDGPDAVHGAFSEVNKHTYQSHTQYRFGKRKSHKF